MNSRVSVPQTEVWGKLNAPEEKMSQMITQNPHQKFAGLVTHNNINPIGRYDEENPLALGLKTKYKHNYQPFHLHRGILFFFFLALSGL